MVHMTARANSFLDFNYPRLTYGHKVVTKMTTMFGTVRRSASTVTTELYVLLSCPSITTRAMRAHTGGAHMKVTQPRCKCHTTVVQTRLNGTLWAHMSSRARWLPKSFCGKLLASFCYLCSHQRYIDSRIP